MKAHPRGWAAARLLFVTVAVGAAWWGLQGRWGEISDAVIDVRPLGLVMALGATCLGLLATAVVWHTILAGLGARLPFPGAASIFFVGQLGKYIPGSVWSVGAQAQAASRRGVSARATAAGSLVFLFVHVVSGIIPVAVLGLAGELLPLVPAMLWVLALLGAVALLTPWVLARLGRFLAGRALVVGPRDWVRLIGCMTGVWLLYGVAVAAVTQPGVSIWLLLGSFAAAYVAGVLVVFAPAGLGAREGVMIALLAPRLGVGDAAAVALVIRVVHTLADVLMAAGATWVQSRQRERQLDHQHRPG